MTPEQIAEQSRLVGQRAKAARLAQGLTVEELAGALGLRVLDYQDCEEGRRSFRSRVVPALCLALKLTPNELFGIDPSGSAES